MVASELSNRSRTKMYNVQSVSANCYSIMWHLHGQLRTIQIIKSTQNVIINPYITSINNARKLPCVMMELPWVSPRGATERQWAACASAQSWRKLPPRRRASPESTMISLRYHQPPINYHYETVLTTINQHWPLHYQVSRFDDFMGLRRLWWWMINGKMMADDGILGEVVCVHARNPIIHCVNTKQWLDLGFQSVCWLATSFQMLVVGKLSQLSSPPIKEHLGSLISFWFLGLHRKNGGSIRGVFWEPSSLAVKIPSLMKRNTGVAVIRWPLCWPW